MMTSKNPDLGEIDDFGMLIKKRKVQINEEPTKIITGQRYRKNYNI